MCEAAFYTDNSPKALIHNSYTISLIVHSYTISLIVADFKLVFLTFQNNAACDVLAPQFMSQHSLHIFALALQVCLLIYVFDL